MQLCWIEYWDGFRERDDAYVLNEEEPLEPQALEALRSPSGPEYEDEDSLDIKAVYPLAAVGVDGREYQITLTPVEPERELGS